MAPRDRNKVTGVGTLKPTTWGHKVEVWSGGNGGLGAKRVAVAGREDVRALTRTFGT